MSGAIFTIFMPYLGHSTPFRCHALRSHGKRSLFSPLEIQLNRKMKIGFLSLPFTHTRTLSLSQLDKRHTRQMAKMENVAASDKNFSNSKVYYLRSAAPKLPCLPHVLKLIFFIFENASYLDAERTIINFFVIRMAGRQLIQFEEFQENAAGYQLLDMEKSPSLRSLLENWTCPLREEEMYARSLAIFPRGSDVGDVEPERLMTSCDLSVSIDPSVLLRVYNVTSLKQRERRGGAKEKVIGEREKGEGSEEGEKKGGEKEREEGEDSKRKRRNLRRSTSFLGKSGVIKH